jgi:Phage derived protein Gp49-like (DUF891)
VKEFLEALDEKDAAAVAVAMEEIRDKGLASARHLQGKIYEVRANGNKVIYRILFAPQGEGAKCCSLSRVLRRRGRRPRPRSSVLPSDDCGTGKEEDRINEKRQPDSAIDIFYEILSQI